MGNMPDSRKQAADAHGVSLREFIDLKFDHQMELLNERAKHHDDEHVIHIEAHAQDHVSTQAAITGASSALESKFDAMKAAVDTRLDGLDKVLAARALDTANMKGYVVGVGAVIGVLLIIANVLGQFFSVPVPVDIVPPS